MKDEKEVFIHEIATTLPENSYSQEFALDYILRLQGDSLKKRNFLTRIYQGTAIEKRYTVISDYGKAPEDFTFYPKSVDLKPEPSTKQRNDLYITESNKLALEAARKLLGKMPEFNKNKITHIITVSCTGMAAPGFDFHITKELELNPYVNRFHIGFMGCYAAFPALKLAKNICLSEPEARVLVVNLELCSLHFQDNFETDIIVANAIFSDGVSAALISGSYEDSTGNKISLNNFSSRYISDSENDMAWKIGDHGFDMKLSVYVPKIIEENISPILNDLLEKSDVKKDEIDFWAIHPGGRAILEKIEKLFGLKKSDLSYSYEVLRDYGNMSSATIMFLLEKILKEDKYGKIFSSAFGPGLTIETGLMEKIQ